MAQIKKKVFISFDFDNDKTLKDFLIGQSKLSDSPFEVTDVSLKEAAPEKDWEEKARAKIKRADLVLVIVGMKTHNAPGVKKEVKMAREEKKPIYQLKPQDTNPTPVPDGGRLLLWSWPNLKNLFN